MNQTQKPKWKISNVSFFTKSEEIEEGKQDQQPKLPKSRNGFHGSEIVNTDRIKKFPKP